MAANSSGEFSREESKQLEKDMLKTVITPAHAPSVDWLPWPSDTRRDEMTGIPKCRTVSREEIHITLLPRSLQSVICNGRFEKLEVL